MSREIPKIIAILRGVMPDEILPVAAALIESGIRGIEVPLNSPDAFTSIQRLSAAHGESCLCGAGTVLTAAQVDQVHAAGGRLIVSPNTDERVIGRAVELGLVAMPGFATATEAFTAIQAGAQVLKLFPAATYGPRHVAALRAVLPKETSIYAVGGVGSRNLSEWMASGITGVGIGTEIYVPGRSLSDLKLRAEAAVAALGATRTPGKTGN